MSVERPTGSVTRSSVVVVMLGRQVFRTPQSTLTGAFFSETIAGTVEHADALILIKSTTRRHQRLQLCECFCPARADQSGFLMDTFIVNDS